MRVLFIGGTGFISTAVSRMAVERGLDLTLLNRGQRAPSIPGASHLAADINGGRGFIVHNGDKVEATVAFGYDEVGNVSGIYIMRNPDKLARLDATAIH